MGLASYASWLLQPEVLSPIETGRGCWTADRPRWRSSQSGVWVEKSPDTHLSGLFRRCQFQLRANGSHRGVQVKTTAGAVFQTAANSWNVLCGQLPTQVFFPSPVELAGIAQWWGAFREARGPGLNLQGSP